MNDSAAFGLAMRVVGLLTILWGLMQALSMVVMMSSAGFGSMPFGYPLLMAVLSLGVGFYLLRGAPLIQRLAYGDRE